MNLFLQISQKSAEDVVFCSGTITEDASLVLSTFPRKKIGKTCTFNFKKITYVNSCGVRAWTQFIREFEKGRSLSFEECPSSVVMQLIMVPSFRSTAIVKSIYCSHLCESCNIEQTELLDIDQTDPKKFLHYHECPSCHKPMELAEEADEFFKHYVPQPSFSKAIP